MEFEKTGAHIMVRRKRSKSVDLRNETVSKRIKEIKSDEPAMGWPWSLCVFGVLRRLRN